MRRPEPMLQFTPDEAVDLPVDDLGMLVLADIVATRERNEYNYGNLLGR
jgi:hypothetical protein